jgi:V/A-type H+/Na+-transporting ATPase subunit I
MAIVQVKKLTFSGLLREKTAVLQALQEVGGSHLIPLNKATATVPVINDGHNAENTVLALKYLNSCARQRHQVLAASDFELDVVVKMALDLQTQIRNLTDERDSIKKRIKEITPWGNFNIPDHTQLAGLNFWFYIVPQRLLTKLPPEGLVWQVVYRDNLRCYVVVIAQDEPPPGSMPVPRTHTGTRSLDTLKKRLNYVELQLEDKQAERESLTRWISLMALQRAQTEDQSALTAAQGLTLDQAGVFVMQAWVDEANVPLFDKFAQQHQLALLVADPEPGENPPTLLKNNTMVAGAEDLLSFYQTPNYYSWDPSGIVFWSVAVFFAMILSDAGYALLLGVYLAIKWRSIKTGLLRDMRMLMLVTLLFSLLWGILIGSFFGYIVPADSVMGRFKALDMEDFDSMMRLSIAVGVTHLTLSNLVMSYQHKGKAIACASLGWAAITLGGFGVWMAYMNHVAWLQQGGYIVMASGAFAVLGWSGQTPVHTFTDAGKRLLEGLHSLTDITKLFGNTLSYMRLFALGLAGASLALTFNKLAVEVYHALPGLGLLCSILILLFGHALNIVLCLISGVLHGLRLNFIEFFNWSLTEEGYPFKAFSKNDRTGK